jgi:hypothetical protein
MNEYTFTRSKIELKQEAKPAKIAGQVDVDDSSNSVVRTRLKTTSREYFTG